MIDYIQKQDQLHSKATEIINDLELRGILSKHGQVAFVGSFALKLMSWEDVDIVVYAEPNIDNFLNTVDTIFRKENVYNINIQDFRKSIHPNRPQGLYCGISYLVKPDVFWKIDVWFLPAEADNALKTVEWVNERLTPENRDIILSIKNEMREKTLHGKEVTGGAVYKAVLESNVKNLDGFRDYLKKQGRDL